MANFSAVGKGLVSSNKRGKLSDEITEQLRDYIVNGDIAAGEQLPTESALIDKLGVSRTVIREAISALKADGLVNSVQGVGVFVNQDLSQRPFRLDAGDLSPAEHLDQIIELRLCLEVEASRLAAMRCNEASLEKISIASDNMKKACDAGQPAFKEDFEFHLQISAAAGNTYLTAFLKFLGTHIIPKPSIRTNDGMERRQYLEQLLEEHSKIEDAIKAKDSKAAASAMHSHLISGLELNRSETV